MRERRIIAVILFAIASAISAAPRSAGTEEEARLWTTSSPDYRQKSGANMRDYWLNTPDSTRHREYARAFETGGSIGAGIAQDLYLGFFDIFKKGANVLIDFNEVLNRPALSSFKGLNINAEVNFTLLYFKMKHPLIGDFGFSFFNINSRIDINFDEDFISFIAKGNLEKHNTAPEITISGALFAEIFSTEFRRIIFKHFFVTLKPSWYIPVFYIPKSVQKLEVSAENGFKAELSGGAYVYTPINIKDWTLTSFGGLDADFIIERPIFNILDIGLELLHLPLMPAVLSSVSVMGLEGVLLDIPDDYSFKMPEIDQFYDTKNIWALRPVTTGLYLLYRPFGTDRLILRPEFSLTFLNPSGQLYINAGLEAVFAPSNIFGITLFTGLREGLARHSVKLSFNWRRFGFYIKLDLRSQDYLRSWTLKGAGFSLGWSAGY
ncbi:MAG: hypothetical protein LBG72_00915 [Spirochaetaceae bacterium]|jgi:hypothetical protein|nr:hypothetical protein [Spirochaetaceae bacterium]